MKEYRITAEDIKEARELGFTLYFEAFKLLKDNAKAKYYSYKMLKSISGYFGVNTHDWLNNDAEVKLENAYGLKAVCIYRNIEHNLIDMLRALRNAHNMSNDTLCTLLEISTKTVESFS